MTPIWLFAAYGVLLVVAMYLFVYIPGQRKRRKMREFHDSLAVGDHVVTAGGVVGRVVSREGDYVFLMVDEEKQVVIQVILYAIQGRK